MESCENRRRLLLLQALVGEIIQVDFRVAGNVPPNARCQAYVHTSIHLEILAVWVAWGAIISGMRVFGAGGCMRGWLYTRPIGHERTLTWLVGD